MHPIKIYCSNLFAVILIQALTLASDCFAIEHHFSRILQCLKLSMEVPLKKEDPFFTNLTSVSQDRARQIVDSITTSKIDPELKLAIIRVLKSPELVENVVLSLKESTQREQRTLLDLLSRLQQVEGNLDRTKEKTRIWETAWDLIKEIKERRPLDVDQALLEIHNAPLRPLKSNSELDQVLSQLTVAGLKGDFALLESWVARVPSQERPAITSKLLASAQALREAAIGVKKSNQSLKARFENAINYRDAMYKMIEDLAVYNPELRTYTLEDINFETQTINGSRIPIPVNAELEYEDLQSFAPYLSNIENHTFNFEWANIRGDINQITMMGRVDLNLLSHEARERYQQLIKRKQTLLGFIYWLARKREANPTTVSLVRNRATPLGVQRVLETDLSLLGKENLLPEIKRLLSNPKIAPWRVFDYWDELTTECERIIKIKILHEIDGNRQFLSRDELAKDQEVLDKRERIFNGILDRLKKEP